MYKLEPKSFHPMREGTQNTKLYTYALIQRLLMQTALSTFMKFQKYAPKESEDFIRNVASYLNPEASAEGASRNLTSVLLLVFW